MPTSPSTTRPAQTAVQLARQRASGTINHLGVEVSSTEQVTQAGARLGAEGLETEPEPGAVCCYALPDKVWAHDPDSLAWEYYTVLEHIDTPWFTCGNTDLTWW